MKKLLFNLLSLFIVLNLSACTITIDIEDDLIKEDNLMFVNTSNQDSPLGINLGFLNYYDVSFTFLNIFNESMTWIPQHKDDGLWDTGEELNLDENGWISFFDDNQTAATLIRRGLEEYPIGEYVLTYEGEGKISIGFDGKKTSEELGRIDFEVKEVSSAGIIIGISETNPENYIRNIKVYEKRYEDLINAGETFYPEFLDKIKKFNTIRYMDFGATNANESVKWSDRTKKLNYTQGMKNGASYEYMVELSNRLNANPWICIPHKADDDYVRNMAILIRDSLNSNLTLYIEYTNEPWNWGYKFPAVYLSQQFTNEGLELEDGVWAKNTAYYSYRASQCMKIFEEEFGGTDRIVRVLGAQAAWDSPAREALKYQDNYKNFDAIAIAPYYDANKAFDDEEYINEHPNPTVDDVIELCRESVDKSTRWVEQNKIVADEYGMDLIAYEGGPHLTIVNNPTNKETLDKIFIEAGFHPDMEEVYKHYLEEWKRVGGNLFVHYKAFDSRWGLYKSVFDDDNSPKAKAAIEFMEENPKWW